MSTARRGKNGRVAGEQTASAGESDGRTRSDASLRHGSVGGPDSTALKAALRHLRACVADLRFPLPTADAERARAQAHEVLDQLDDYLLPRLDSLDAPLLAVIGGSTGAGKSTLLNSLLGRTVSPAGVLRPTTRSPLLVHHPRDGAWFTGDRILPGLPRVSGDVLAHTGAEPARVPQPNPSTAAWRARPVTAAPGATGATGRTAVAATPMRGRAVGDTTASGEQGLHLVPDEAMPAGLALLDAPDVDSVVTANRTLAAELLAAADLWLFVTTAARYADAVPWDLLKAAARRSTAVAVVLDRVAPEDAEEVLRHLAEMLAGQGLGRAPLFIVPESRVLDGRLPPEAVAAVSNWLDALAASAEARAAVVRGTLQGAVKDLVRRAPTLADAADAQVAAGDRLRAVVNARYEDAVEEVAKGTSDGTLLRGEVLARWQDFVGTGEMLRALESKVGALRDRVSAVLHGRPNPPPQVEVAIETGLEALIRDRADQAAEQVFRAWRDDPVGSALAADLSLSRSSADLGDAVTREIRAWQAGVLALVSEEGAARRTTARTLSFGVNGLGVALMVSVFASTGGVTGAEVGIAGGTAVIAQRVLEAVFGDDAVRRLTRTAHEDLRRRVSGLYEHDRARFTSLVDDLGVPATGGAGLREATRQVDAEQIRLQAGGL